MPSRVSSWLTPAAWVAAVTAALLLVFPVGFPNYDTIYALVWGRELAHGVSPDYGAALPPTPHPLTDLIGLRDDAARRRRDHGDDDRRLRLAGPDRLPRLPPRQPLVRPLDRRRRGRDRPHPGALPLQRPARLHRPALHRPLPRRPDDRGKAPARRLARPGPAGPGWPAAPRGLALRRRLLALAGVRPPSRGADGPPRHLHGGKSAHRRSFWVGVELAQGALGAGAGLARRAGGGRTDPLGALRRDHHRRPALLADRNPGNGRGAEAADRAGRPRPLRPAGARRSAAVAGDGRRARRGRPRLRLPAPTLGARHRRRRPRPRRLRPAGRRRPGDHRPLHDAGRRRSWRSSSPSPCSAGGCWNATIPGAGAGSSSPASSR